MFDEDLSQLSQRVGEALKKAGIKLATAESCTGGWVAKIVTDTAGSSQWFVCGLTTYSNQAKNKLLGVSDITLERNGAVSEETAFEMAEGALYRTDADIALAVTGIAGPVGGTPNKPVGTVCFAWCRRHEMAKTVTHHFDGDREQVRRQSAAFALEGLVNYLAHPPGPVRSVQDENARRPLTLRAEALPAATGKSESPFEMIEEAKSRLATLLDRLRLDQPDLGEQSADPAKLSEQCRAVADTLAQQEDFAAAVLTVAQLIQDACALDLDAMLGFAHLDDVGPYTVLHPLHQAIFGEIFTCYLAYPPAKRASVACAALTSNIAMLDLQETLWHQDGPLSDVQKQMLHLHPALGHDMLKRLGVDDPIWLDAVLTHHEHIDGKGYPAGMSGDKIPIAARIIALTDIYDAMVMPRKHRPPNPRAALRELLFKRGQAVGSELATMAVKGLGVYPPGTFVKLLNGEIAIVIKRVARSVHPIVRSLIGPRGAPLDRPYRRNTEVAMFNIQDVVPRDRSITINFRHIWDYAD